MIQTLFLLKKWKIIPINKRNKRIFIGLNKNHNLFERKKKSINVFYEIIAGVNLFSIKSIINKNIKFKSYFTLRFIKLKVYFSYI